MYSTFATFSVKETFLSNHPGATPAPPGLGPKPLRSRGSVTLQVPPLTPYASHTHTVRPDFLTGSTFPQTESQASTAASQTSVFLK